MVNYKINHIKNTNFFSTFSASSVVSQPVHSKQANAHVTGVFALATVFPPILYHSSQGEWVVKTTPSYAIPLITFLKRHTATYYRQLRDITAVDQPKRKFRFEVLYQLLSIIYNQRLTVSVSVSEGSALNSVTGLYSSAGWYEREIWDMFGVFFRNHFDLRRRLTDYGFKGHPLRKDFPVTGFFEVNFNYFYKRISYVKVNLSQVYRVFTVSNTWAGNSVINYNK